MPGACRSGQGRSGRHPAVAEMPGREAQASARSGPGGGRDLTRPAGYQPERFPSGRWTLGADGSGSSESVDVFLVGGVVVDHRRVGVRSYRHRGCRGVDTPRVTRSAGRRLCWVSGARPAAGGCPGAGRPSERVRRDSWGFQARADGELVPVAAAVRDETAGVPDRNQSWWLSCGASLRVGAGPGQGPVRAWPSQVRK